MLNNPYIEMQTNKRVQKFLLHKSTQENIEAANAKLVIGANGKEVSVLLLNQNTIVKPLSIRDIAAFFGKDYDENNERDVISYLTKLSKENQIELSKVNVVICETKGMLGAHLYEDTKHKKRISTFDFLAHLNSTK